MSESITNFVAISHGSALNQKLVHHHMLPQLKWNFDQDTFIPPSDDPRKQIAFRRIGITVGKQTQSQK